MRVPPGTYTARGFIMSFETLPIGEEIIVVTAGETTKVTFDASLFLGMLTGTVSTAGVAGAGGFSVPASIDGAAMSMSISPTQACPNDKDPGDVCVDVDSAFTVTVSADAIPVDNGYIGYSTFIQYGNTGLTYKSATSLWPDAISVTFLCTDFGTGVTCGALSGLIPPQPASFHKGDLVSFEFNGPAQKSQGHVLDLETQGGPNAATNGNAYAEFGGPNIAATGNTITLHCLNAPGAPTHTATQTPDVTATNTPSPTASKTPTETPTPTNTLTPTKTPTNTPVPTATETPTVTPTPLPPVTLTLFIAPKAGSLQDCIDGIIFVTGCRSISLSPDEPFNIPLLPGDYNAAIFLFDVQVGDFINFTIDAGNVHDLGTPATPDLGTVEANITWGILPEPTDFTAGLVTLENEITTSLSVVPDGLSDSVRVPAGTYTARGFITLPFSFPGSPEGLPIGVEVIEVIAGETTKVSFDASLFLGMVTGTVSTAGTAGTGGAGGFFVPACRPGWRGDEHDCQPNANLSRRQASRRRLRRRRRRVHGHRER